MLATSPATMTYNETTKNMYCNGRNLNRFVIVARQPFMITDAHPSCTHELVELDKADDLPKPEWVDQEGDKVIHVLPASRVAILQRA